MRLKNSSKEIAILLPFKEHFGLSHFGSVSLYIKDLNEYSKFKKNVVVYCNFKGASLGVLKRCNLKKNFFHYIFGRNIGHTKCFISTILNKKKYPSVIEVHNRPKSALLIKRKIEQSKIILFFHNDPMSFKECIKTSDREELIDKCHKICFVSNFLKKRFLQGISYSKNLNSKFKVIYNGVSPLTNQYKNKRKQNIVYVGELSKNKGFDIFLESIIDVKANFPNWEVDIFGRPNEKYNDFFSQNKKINFHGFTKHKNILSFLNNSSISVIPSVWNEPFGRTLIESINAKVSTISSTKGGLREICNHFNVVKLNKISKKSIYNAIKKLIMSPHDRKFYSNNNVSNSPFTLKKITVILDNIRSEIY